MRRLLDDHFTVRSLAQTARVTGIRRIDLVRDFLAGHANALDVDDDDVVARIQMRRVGWLVLAAQDFRHVRREAAKGLAIGVDDVPARRNLGWLGAVGPSWQWHLLVLDSNLNQPLGRREPQAVGGATMEQRIDPIECPLAPADVDERAGDAANHAIEKRVSGHRDRDPVAGRANFYRLDAAHGVTAGPRATAEGTKIMLPDQPIAGCLHRADIERVTQAPRVLALVGASRKRLANRVCVMPGAGRVARIERVIDKLGVPDGDITRESRVQRPGQLLDREVGLEAG